MVKTCKIILPILLLIAICPSVFAYTTTQNTYTLDCTGDFNNITFYANSFNQIGADSLHTTDDGDLVTADISVPITMYKSGLSPATGYLNGYYKFSCNITITGSETTNFRNFNVEFIKSENDGLYLATYEATKQSTNNSYTLRYNLYFVFQNFYWSGTYGQDLLIARIHYSDLATNGSSFQCTIVPELSNGSGRLRHSESGVVDENLAVSIADAINNSADIDTMLMYLSAISTNTNLLTSVLNKINDLDTKLATALTRLQTIENYNNTQITFLQGLLTALAGTNQIDADLSNNAKNHWISIIQDALKTVKPEVPDDPTLRQNLEIQQANNDAVESNVYDNYDDAITNVNLSPVAPANIAMAISTVLGWLENIYNRLGVIQWVIIFNCTVGIVLIVLGRFRLK